MSSSWGYGSENKEDVSNRFLSSAFDNQVTDDVLSQMLGADPKKPKFCSQCGQQIVGRAFADPNKPTSFYCEKHYVPSNCEGCGKPISGLFVKGKDNTKWHTTCFNEDLPCERCNSPVFGKEIIDSHGGSWHKNCWYCTSCNLKIGLTSNEYVLHNGLPFCPHCAKNPQNLQNAGRKGVDPEFKAKAETQRKAAEKEIYDNIQSGKSSCGTCGKTITVFEAVEFNNKLFHPDCFTCGTCHQVIGLEDGFSKRGDAPICSKCVKNVGNCAACKKPVSGKYLTGPGGGLYHQQCFACVQCKAQLSSGFLPIDGKAYCPTCANKVQQKQPTKTETKITTGRAGGFTIDPRTGQKKYHN